MRPFLLLCLIWCCLATAALATRPQQVVMLVTLEGVSLDQFAQWDLPEFRALLHTGAIGVMNIKSGGAPTADHVAVTISAGTRANGADEQQSWAGQGYSAREMVADHHAGHLFTEQNGVTIPDTAVVQLAIADLRRINAGFRHEVIPGLLGEQLQRAGVTTHAFGNADQGKRLSRNAVAIAMNRDGWVSAGDVSRRILIPAPGRPFQVRTNYRAIFHRLTQLSSGAHFLVIDAGDMHRLLASHATFSPDQYAAQQRLITEECLRVILRADRYFRQRDIPFMLILAVIQQDEQAFAHGDYLTPIIMTGTDVPVGLLTSRTTRRPGVVTNLDLTATILHAFGVTPHRSIFGTPIYSRPHDHALTWLQRMNAQSTAIHVARTPLTLGYAVLLAIVLLASLIGILVSSRHTVPLSMYRWAAALRFSLIALMLVPLAFILAPGLHLYTTVPVAVFTLFSTSILTLILTRNIRDVHLILALIGLATTAVICGDLLAGAPLMKQSVIGYDVSVGIRFYGLGNECAGFLVGAMLLGPFALLECISLQQRRRAFLPILLTSLCIFFLIGSPQYGTDFGGMLTALVGGMVALILAFGRAHWRRWLLVGGATILVLFAALLVLNMIMPETQQTHIGRAFNTAMHDPGYLWEIALRKWGMNFTLILSHYWISVPGFLIVTAGCLIFFRSSLGQHTFQNRSMFTAGLSGIAATALVGFLTNDSGVISAATSALFVVFPVLLMAYSPSVTPCAADGVCEE